MSTIDRTSPPRPTAGPQPRRGDRHERPERFEDALRRAGRPTEAAPRRPAGAKRRRLHGDSPPPAIPDRRRKDGEDAGRPDLAAAMAAVAPGAAGPTADGAAETLSAAPAAGSAALGATMRQLAERIARAAAVEGAPGELGLELDLGRLGGGRVKVGRNLRGQLEISFQLDRDGAREAVARNLDELRQGLAERGLEVAAITLRTTEGPTLTPSGAEAEPRQRQRQGEDQRERRRPPETAGQEEEEG